MSRPDCVFFEEVKDMGSTIPMCKYHSGYVGRLKCVSCDKRLTIGDAKKFVDDRERDLAYG